MVGISAISISGAPLSSAVGDGSAVAGEKKTLNVDLPKLNDSGESKKAASSSAEEEPAYIKQLRQMIKDLQKQLAEQMKQLQQVMASKMEEGAKVSAVAGAQAAVSSTTAAIQSATAVLLKALLDSGGSSTGAMVSTTA